MEEISNRHIQRNGVGNALSLELNGFHTFSSLPILLNIQIKRQMEEKELYNQRCC